MIPEILELPEVKTPSMKQAGKPARSALPAIGSEFTMSSGRQREAEEFAAAMGQAFGISKAQNKHQKAKARARTRQVESRNKASDRNVKSAGRRSGRIGREVAYRTTRDEARRLGLGTNLFKRAKL